MVNAKLLSRPHLRNTTTAVVTIKVETVTPVISTQKAAIYAHRSLLVKKYGEEMVRHLDGAFFRRNGSVYIFPTTVYGAIKRALSVAGKQVNPLPCTPMGMIFPEEAAFVYSFSIRAPNGKNTVVNYEAIKPGVEGEALFECKNREAAVELASILKGLVVSIGAFKNKGMGRIRFR